MSTPPLPDAVRDDYAALPSEAQYAAAQFIAFLRRQQAPAPASQNGTPPAKKQKPRKARVPLSEEPAIGMWRDRPEMEDSVAYIRQLRKREFRDPHA